MGQTGGHKIVYFVFLPFITFILAFTTLECIRYWETICDWGHEIANFVFLSYIYFILAFRDLQCIKRYWETICEESR